MLEMTVSAEIVLGGAPSPLSLLVLIFFTRPSSSSGIHPLISRATTAMSMVPLMIQVGTPAESDFILKIPVHLVLLNQLLMIVVVARSSIIMIDLIDSLLKQRSPLQMRAKDAVAQWVLLEGHILR